MFISPVDFSTCVKRFHYFLIFIFGLFFTFMENVSCHLDFVWIHEVEQTDEDPHKNTFINNS